MDLPAWVAARERSPWGRTLYVNSAHSRASDVGRDGLDRDHPLATLARAVFVAQTDDVILIGPGHVETIGIPGLFIALAGLQVVGIGTGRRRPHFLTRATVWIQGDGVRLENLQFTHDAVNVPTILIAASNLDLVDLLLNDALKIPISNIVTHVSVDCDDVSILRLKTDQPTAPGDSAIAFADVRRMRIEGCHISGNYSLANIENPTAAAEDIVIADNWLANADPVDMNFYGLAGASGILSGNRCRIATDGETSWFDTLGALSLSENYGVNDDGETGKLIGTPSV